MQIGNTDNGPLKIFPNDASVLGVLDSHLTQTKTTQMIMFLKKYGQMSESNQDLACKIDDSPEESVAQCKSNFIVILCGYS